MKIFWIAIAIGLTICSLHNANAADLAVGKAVPSFSIQTLEGQSITPSTAKGRVLIINLWTTWCEPCRKEMPAIESFYQKYHTQGVDVVAVSMDEPSDLAKVKTVLKSFSFQGAMEKDSNLQKFGRIWRVPLTFVIDQSGILRRNGWEGNPLVDEAILEKTVTPLLMPPAAN